MGFRGAGGGFSLDEPPRRSVPCEQHEGRVPLKALVPQDPISITWLRARRGLTQSELGDRVGCSQPNISQLENGRHGAKLSLLRRLAACLRTTIGALLYAKQVVSRRIGQGRGGTMGRKAAERSTPEHRIVDDRKAARSGGLRYGTRDWNLKWRDDWRERLPEHLRETKPPRKG